MKLADWMVSQDPPKTDEEVAAAIGRDRSTVSRLRRGVLRPQPELMARIADYTGGQVLPNDWFELLSQRESAA